MGTFLQSASAIAMIATPMIIAGFGAWHSHSLAVLKTSIALQNAKLDTVSDRIGALQISERLPLSHIAHSCNASNTSVECVFTNSSMRAVSTCFVGKLGKRKGEGTLRSLPACTGRLEPNSTKMVSSFWIGGFAKDLCSSTTRWGNDVLDWTTCAFDVESVTDPTPPASTM